MYSAWTKDGIPIQNNDKFKIDLYEEYKNTVTLSLKISDIRSHDFGIYRCEAQNELGRDFQDFFLDGKNFLQFFFLYNRLILFALNNLSHVYIEKPFHHQPSHLLQRRVFIGPLFDFFFIINDECLSETEGLYQFL